MKKNIVIFSIVIMLIIFIVLFFLNSISTDNPKQNASETITDIRLSDKSQKIIVQLLDDIAKISNLLVTDKNLKNEDKNTLNKVITNKIELLKQLFDQKMFIIPFKDKISGNSSHQISATVKCALCSGSGYVGGQLCSACGGDGYAWTPDQEGHEKICAACDGTGNSHGKICQACNGTGWANSMPNPKMPKSLQLMLGE